jgi:hypothetical protein
VSVASVYVPRGELSNAPLPLRIGCKYFVEPAIAGVIFSVLDAVASVRESIRLSFLWRPTLPDPSDDMVLEAAMNGRADLLVTLNRRHFASVPAHFGVNVVSPAEALPHLREAK